MSKGGVLIKAKPVPNMKRLTQILLGEIPMYMALQPIQSLISDVVIGHEALARWETNVTLNPLDVWRTALFFGQLDPLEDLVRNRVAALRQHIEGKLFVNLHPLALNPSRWISLVDRDIVLEITEAEAIDYKGVAELKAAGFSVALDDLGTGHATFEALVRIQPDFIKIDKSLIKGCHKDPHQWSLLRSLVEHGQRVGAQVLAEGIETQEDLEAVRRSGCEFGQGYLLGYPEKLWLLAEKRK